MLLKFVIVILFIAVLTSLVSGFYFLSKDQGSPRRRLLYALGTRIVLAALLLLAIGYGFYSGQLSSKAPWDPNIQSEAVDP